MEWFLYKSGQVEGPLSQLELLTKINSGEIGDDELMCKKGDDQWKTLKDFRPELFVEPKEQSDSPPVIRDWILLIENMSLENSQNKEGQFLQSGPFAKDEVLNLIQTGQAKYSDYIWKTGFQQWARINEVDEFFGPTVSAPATEPQASEALAAEVHQDLLENVLKQVNDSSSLDFVESFPEAIEPKQETVAAVEPLVSAELPKSTDESLDFVESTLSEPQFAMAETDILDNPPSTTFEFSKIEEPPVSTRVKSAPHFSLPKFEWSVNVKQTLDRAAQGTFLPWLMLSMSLAVTGIFAIWYFTGESNIAPSASMPVPMQEKPADNQRPSLVPKKGNASQTTPKAAWTEPSAAPVRVVKASRASKKAVAAKMAVSKKQKKASTPAIEKVARQFQKKAETLDRQYFQLKDRPFEWKRFYTNWKQELSDMDEASDLSGHQGTALLKKLTFGKRRLVQRASMMDQSIVSEKAVSSDFEEENVPQIFRDIMAQSRSKKR